MIDVKDGQKVIKFFDEIKIYNNNKIFIKEYVMYVNCAHGKGIRFIRDELKFFAKTNYHMFKKNEKI